METHDDIWRSLEGLSQQGGWYCPGCQQLVKAGDGHLCNLGIAAQQANPSLQQQQSQISPGPGSLLGWAKENSPARPPSSGWTPHKCPVCEGRGKLSYDPANPFANSALNFWSAGSIMPLWSCHACAGTGVLWG